MQTYSKTHPKEMPTALEAGTLNGHGIAGLHAAVEYLMAEGIDKIRTREQKLMWRFYEGVKDIPNVKVESFSGLLVDYAKEKDVHVVIRGLRAITDFEYELQTAQTNAKLSNGAVDTVFLTTGLEYAYLSSSSVKEIASFGGDISMCVPDFLGKQIYDKYGIERNEPEAME